VVLGLGGRGPVGLAPADRDLALLGLAQAPDQVRLVRTGGRPADQLEVQGLQGRDVELGELRRDGGRDRLGCQGGPRGGGLGRRGGGLGRRGGRLGRRGGGLGRRGAERGAGALGLLLGRGGVVEDDPGRLHQQPRHRLRRDLPVALLDVLLGGVVAHRVDVLHDHAPGLLHVHAGVRGGRGRRGLRCRLRGPLARRGRDVLLALRLRQERLRDLPDQEATIGAEGRLAEDLGVAGPQLGQAQILEGGDLGADGLVHGCTPPFWAGPASAGPACRGFTSWRPAARRRRGPSPWGPRSRS